MTTTKSTSFDHKVLIVLTSHSELGNTGEKTGFWVEEFAAPFYALKDAGIELVLATPKGGQAPVDPKSELPDFQTPATVRFNQDSETQALVASTHKLSAMNMDDFDAVFYPGGHGPMWDLAGNTDSIALIEKAAATQKPVAVVCHSTSALLEAKDSNGEYLVAGKGVTGFSNSEEAAVQLTDVVPFLLEDELMKRGADYQKVADWAPFAIQDGLLISGQNPSSSGLVAEKLIETLKNKEK